MDEWKVVKISHRGDVVIIEDVSGQRDAYVRMIKNYGSSKEEAVGIGISLRGIKVWFPECSEVLLRYVLDKYVQSGHIYDDLKAYVEYLLYRDKNIIYDDDNDCYYLKSELKEGNHE